MSTIRVQPIKWCTLSELSQHMNIAKHFVRYLNAFVLRVTPNQRFRLSESQDTITGVFPRESALPIIAALRKVTDIKYSYQVDSDNKMYSIVITHGRSDSFLTIGWYQRFRHLQPVSLHLASEIII